MPGGPVASSQSLRLSLRLSLRGQLRDLLLVFALLLPRYGSAADVAVAAEPSPPPASGVPARVVIVSPHVEAIRAEFGRGFAAWYERVYGAPAEVDWRIVGGTSESLRFVQSEFARKPEGIGVDVFFGGGQEPYHELAEKRQSEIYRPPAAVIDAIPARVAGTDLYAADHAWHGAAISSFGILQNLQIQRLAHLPPVTRWEQLADPRLAGWVGAGDPRNSGTMNVMFETFLQALGWEKGWETLTRISANVRRFERLSSTVAKDVTYGETAYGLTIDFYGFIQVAAGGRTNLSFVLPDDFAAVSPDGIALLKGAPHPEAARRFIDFVLGEEGQKLWVLPRGHPEGPRDYDIERMPVRPDLYERYREVSNVQRSPFSVRGSFRYDGRLGQRRRGVVAALAGALLVDTHAELLRAARAVARRGFSEADLADLGSVPLTEEGAARLAAGDWKEAIHRNRLRTEWLGWAAAKYERLARGGVPFRSSR